MINHNFAVTTFYSHKKWITITVSLYNYAIANHNRICDSEKSQSRLPLEHGYKYQFCVSLHGLTDVFRAFPIDCTIIQRQTFTFLSTFSIAFQIFIGQKFFSDIKRVQCQPHDRALIVRVSIVRPSLRHKKELDFNQEKFSTFIFKAPIRRQFFHGIPSASANSFKVVQL